MAKRGRKKIEISQKQFEGLCAIQCTLEEMCGVLGCCEDTLEKWCKTTYGKKFSEVFREKRGAGKASLRRTQFRLAESNATMAIFLGKQYLGQYDKVETDNKVEFESDGFIEALKGDVKDTFEEAGDTVET